jgi:hypothetical protein
MSLTYFLFDVMIVKLLFLASFYFLSFYTFYVGFKIYKSGYIVGLHFLFSTGIGAVFMSLFMLTFYTTMIPINIWSITLVNQGLIWDVIALSLALAYRIKLLQEENKAKESLIFIKSRQEAIGELTGNIAHQWRSPLAELGAINSNLEAKLKYATIEKDEILNTLSMNTKILRHLSLTVETFQSFFQNQHSDETFYINDELSRCVD